MASYFRGAIALTFLAWTSVAGATDDAPGNFKMTNRRARVALDREIVSATQPGSEGNDLYADPTDRRGRQTAAARASELLSVPECRPQPSFFTTACCC